MNHTTRRLQGSGLTAKATKDLSQPGTLVALFKDGTADFAVGRVAQVSGALCVVTDRGTQRFEEAVGQLVGIVSAHLAAQHENVVTPEQVNDWSVGLKPDRITPLVLYSPNHAK